MEKLTAVIHSWQEQLASSLLFLLIGVAIGIGQLLHSNEQITVRILVGRALSTGGLAMGASTVLVWVPDLPLAGQIGIAATLASLGTAALERAFQRVLESRS